MHSIRDLLTRGSVFSTGPATSVLEACQAMEEANVGAVLICTAAGELQGIFTERDLMVRVIVAGRDPSTTELREVMSRDLYVAESTLRVSEVRGEMRHRHIRHVPVVENGEVLGVLSLRDLLRADLHEKTQEVEAITTYIQGGLSGEGR